MSRLWSMGVLVSLNIAMGGCSIPFMGNSSTKAPVIEEIKRTPVNKIVMSELDILDRPYKVIGEVFASDTVLIPFSKITKDDVNTKLKEEAFKQGADAIVYVIYTHHEGTWKSPARIEAKGKAVQFTRY